MPSRPAAAAFLYSSRGNSSASSHAAACGMISRATKRRMVSRSASCSSVSAGCAVHDAAPARPAAARATTCAPAATCTALTRTARGTLSACSIFIASSTTSARPASAVSPAFALTATTRPFIGATSRPSLAAAARRAGGACAVFSRLKLCAGAREVDRFVLDQECDSLLARHRSRSRACGGSIDTTRSTTSASPTSAR